MKTLPHDHGQTFQIVADLFKQMSDQSRIRIFWLYATARNVSSISPRL